MWRCTKTFVVGGTKKRRYCGFSVSQFKGSFLHNVHLPAWKVVVFAHHWLSKHWDHETVVEGLGLSTRTSVDWRSFCSEVTDHWLENQEPIGGPGITVEIDETLIARRKYERGRVLSQVWVFGAVERASKKKIVVPLVGPIGEKRDRGTLLPIIQQYIKRGSVIVSDSWRAYHTLKDHGYTHYVVNHSEHFVDPENPDIHTQNIERLWRDLKEWVKRPGIRAKFLYQYLARYLFIKAHHDKSLLHHFFVEAARLYPPLGARERQPPPLPHELSDSEDELSARSDSEEAGPSLRM